MTLPYRDVRALTGQQLGDRELRECLERIQGNFQALSGGGPPAWTEIGSTGAPAFENSWVNYGAGFSTAGYYRHGRRVYLKGLVKSGTVGTVAFTLPVGFRPPAQLHLATVGSDGSEKLCVARVFTGGGVQLGPPNMNTWVSLDGLNFDAGP